MYTYLALNLFTISIPLAYSFEGKIAYYKSWKQLFIAIFLTGAFFLTWDHIFTNRNVWSFNDNYLTGIYILDLPLEEWLFFLTVPFSCVFIYVSIRHFVKKDILQPYVKAITFGLIFILGVAAMVSYDKLYTMVCFFTAIVFLLAHWFIFKKRLLGFFYLAYLVHLIPFFIVNGVLTYLPVVMYDDTQNLGIRLGSIPLEDSIYSLALLLANVSIFEYLKNKDSGKT